MARIFLSHSSGNNAEAIALRDWLVSHGWDDLILDLDPERGLRQVPGLTIPGRCDVPRSRRLRYGREKRADADTAKVLTMDEARRVADNIAKLPELLSRKP